LNFWILVADIGYAIENADLKVVIPSDIIEQHRTV